MRNDYMEDSPEHLEHLERSVCMLKSSIELGQRKRKESTPTRDFTVNGASYVFVVKPRVSGGRTAISKALHSALSQKHSEETQMKMEKRKTRPLREGTVCGHMPGELSGNTF